MGVRNVRYHGNRSVTQTRHLSHRGRSVRLEVPWMIIMLSVTTFKASQHYTPVDLHSNGCDTMLGSKQSLAARTIVRDSQRMLCPCPDTGINTILSTETPARPSGGNDGIASAARKERNKAPPENSHHVGVLRDSHANASGAPLGRLQSARQMLRLKLRESRRKRQRNTRILSPPAD